MVHPPSDAANEPGGFVPDCHPWRTAEVAKQEIDMTVRTKKSRQTTHGIDLKYRPNSYFWALDAGIRLASDITGANRRAMYEQALREGNDALAISLIDEPVLGSEDRRIIGSIHPAFMGGEYLPRRKAQEVEIARITIASTTQDVTCVYARRTQSRIHYRVVDEYEGTTLDRDQRTSTRPLTLKQLTDFFLSSWDLLGCLDANFSDDAYPRDAVHGFIVNASSSFYAEFEDLVRQRVDNWLDEKHADFRAEDEDDE